MAFLDTILGLGAVFFRRPCWQISYLLAKLQNCYALAIHWPSNDSKHALHCNQNIWSWGNYGIVNEKYKIKGQEASSWLMMVTNKWKLSLRVCSSAWQNMSWHFLRWHFGDLAKILVPLLCQGKMAWHFVPWHFGDLEKILVT